MAITWGAPLRNSDGWEVRIGWEFVRRFYPNGTVNSATTYVEDTYDVYVQPRYQLGSSSNTLRGSGDAIYDYSKTVSFSAMNTGGEWLSSNIRKIDTHTVYGELLYGKAQTLSGYWTLEGIHGFSGMTARTANFKFSVPARPYAAPAAPSGLTVTRSSDGRHALNWTRNSPGSTTAPYETQEIQRWDNVSNAYTAVATVGNVPSFTDTGTRSQRRYRWRVRAKNSGGASSWAYSPYVYTTPAPPSNVTAAKSGADIVVTWDAAASPLTNYRLAYEDGGAGVTWAGITTTGTSYTFAAPNPAVTHRYLVASQAGDDPLLLSEYVSSNVVQLQAPPKAPTGLGPSVIDIAVAADIYWTHQSVDTTKQTAREYQWRPRGSASWTSSGKVPTSSPKATIAAGAWPLGVVEWQVRTWGAHADPSPWSSTRLTTVASRPTVEVTAPAAGTFQSSRLTAAWSFSTPGGGAQLAYWVRLYAADGVTVLESREATSAATSYTFGLVVEDQAAYVVGVKAKNAEGLWSDEDRVAVAVDYAEPPAPVVSAEWQVGVGAVALAWETPAAVAPQPEAVSVSVERSTDGGPWVLLGSGLPTSGSMVDPAPATNATSAYRVSSLSGLPSTAAAAPIEVSADAAGWVYLNGGPGLARVLRVKGGTVIDAEFDRAMDFVHVANTSGKPLAVSYDSTEQSFKVAARLAPTVEGSASYAELRAFIREVDPPILYRDPTGERVWGAVHGLRQTAKNNRRMASFTVTETDDDNETTGV